MRVQNNFATLDITIYTSEETILTLGRMLFLLFTTISDKSKCSIILIFIGNIHHSDLHHVFMTRYGTIKDVLGSILVSINLLNFTCIILIIQLPSFAKAELATLKVNTRGTRLIN